MAKFTVTYEDGCIKETLIFRGLEFCIAWCKWDREHGERRAEDKIFDAQIIKAFPELEAGDDLIEAFEILTYGGDDLEIEEALETLHRYE